MSAKRPTVQTDPSRLLLEVFKLFQVKIKAWPSLCGAAVWLWNNPPLSAGSAESMSALKSACKTYSTADRMSTGALSYFLSLQVFLFLDYILNVLTLLCFNQSPSPFTMRCYKSHVLNVLAFGKALFAYCSTYTISLEPILWRVKSHASNLNLRR